MNQPEQVDSPFRKREPVRLGFGMMLILLLMVVSAGVGLLIFNAMRVPAITSELNAWLGITTSSDSDPTDARKAQVVFALFLYTAPMGLGIFVYWLHYLINWIDRRSQAKFRQEYEEEQFRME